MPQKLIVSWYQTVNCTTCWVIPRLTWEEISPARMNEIELFLLHFKKDKLLTVLSIEISEIIKTREMMAHQIWYKKSKICFTSYKLQAHASYEKSRCLKQTTYWEQQILKISAQLDKSFMRYLFLKAKNIHNEKSDFKVVIKVKHWFSHRLCLNCCYFVHILP